MSDDITLPPGARLDPRLGLHGGQYVILTCAICGREVRNTNEGGRRPRRLPSLLSSDHTSSLTSPPLHFVQVFLLRVQFELSFGETGGGCRRLHDSF